MPAKKHIEVSEEEVLKALAAITSTKPFRKAYRLRQLLLHLVNKQLADESHDLKGYNIGLDVFEKGSDFNPILIQLCAFKWCACGVCWSFII